METFPQILRGDADILKRMIFQKLRGKKE